MAKSFKCEYCGKEFESKDKLELHKREEHNDKVCYFCGEEFDDWPFKCKYCGKKFCSKHRLPENHNCTYEKGEEQEEKWFEEKEKKPKEKKTLAKPNKLVRKIKEFGWLKLAIVLIIILLVIRIILKLV